MCVSGVTSKKKGREFGPPPLTDRQVAGPEARAWGRVTGMGSFSRLWLSHDSVVEAGRAPGRVGRAPARTGGPAEATGKVCNRP
jgi:hypothetical protein